MKHYTKWREDDIEKDNNAELLIELLAERDQRRKSEAMLNINGIKLTNKKNADSNKKFKIIKQQSIKPQVKNLGLNDENVNELRDIEDRMFSALSKEVGAQKMKIRKGEKYERFNSLHINVMRQHKDYQDHMVEEESSTSHCCSEDDI